MTGTRDSKPTYWGRPDKTRSAYDFRSSFENLSTIEGNSLTEQLALGDVITTPSEGMLEAIAKATLHDDVYAEDATTANFERQMARLCGKEAGAFVISGTMANQLALRSLLMQPPYAVLVDSHSHIVHWEAGGIAHLSGAMVQAIRPLNERYLTVEDVQRHAVITDDVHKAPTRVISVENTTSGMVIPLEDLQRLKAWARDNNIAVHMDGARLWEAVAASGTSIRDYAECCDILTLDFSKNLGAPIGAMVLGPAKLVSSLKRMRKSIGGGLRQAGVLAAAAQQAVLENFGSSRVDTRGVLRSSHRLATRIGRIWLQNGGKLLRPVETNMVWLDLRGAGVSTHEWNAAGGRRGIRLDGKRLVLHHQICEEAIARLEMVMKEVLQPTYSAALPTTLVDKPLQPARL